MRKAQIKVGRNNEPLLRFRAKRRATDPTFDVTGKDFAVFVKENADAPDADSFAIYRTGSGITIPNPANGEILVQVTKAATENPGSFFYHLDMIDGTRSVTVLYGEWLVRGI